MNGSRTSKRILTHPLAGERVALATMHRKEGAIGPPLEKCLGASLHLAMGVDTDALGTFTGDIQRQGSVTDAARAKAHTAADLLGFRYGIGSEGSFGPDPFIPFVSAGFEVLCFADRKTRTELYVSRRGRTNYETALVAMDEWPKDMLDRCGFPSQAVAVFPEHPRERGQAIAKSLRDQASLAKAISAAAVFSSNGRAVVQTDMRAHVNATRMAEIARLAKALAIRLARLCPSCGAPGFGLVEPVRGLPCRDCGTPTRLVRAELHGCAVCGFQQEKRRRPETMRAEPTWCDLCNP